MVLPTATSNGRGLRFRVLGIPVRFDVWFFVIGVLFNYDQGFEVVALWLAILGGSVLVHELGHALVARTTGARPEIVIHALGGLTSWLPPEAVSRGRRVAISLAGPAAGITLGMAFLAAREAGVGDDGGLAGRAMSMGIVVNVFYGVLNLLPIVPLDGGQTMRDLLPGDDQRRERVAAIVSIVVGVVMTVVALSYEVYFGAVFLAFFIAINVATLRGPRPRPGAQSPAPEALGDALRLHAAGEYDDAAARALQVFDVADARGDYPTANAALQLAALARLEGGQAHEAKRLLLDLPAGSVPPALEGRVLMATGQPQLGLDRLTAGFDAQPDDFNGYHLGVGLAQSGGSERLLALARDPRIPVVAVLGAARGAHDARAFGLAGELAELAGGRAAGREFGFAAFVAARAWARAGAGERALLALRAAAAADPDYARAAAADPSFAGVRGPEFDAAVRGVS